MIHGGHGDMWRDGMTTQTESFYDSIDGALTLEQAAQALALAESGDTGLTPDKGGAPTTTAATESKSATDADTEIEQKASAQGADEPGSTNAKTTTEGDPANAVVLAKDGKHTIPYERLEEARKGERHWKAQAEAAQQKLDGLLAEAKARADAGQAPTKTDNLAAQAAAAIEAGADADLFGDFSEESLKAGVAKQATEVATQAVAKEADQLRAEVRQLREELSKVVQPLQAKQQQDETAAHFNAIYAKHPDADSIAQSVEFKAWVDAQPSAVRNAYWQLFDPTNGGTADQIVEVFDAFKATTEKPPAQTAAATAAAAKAATQNVRVEPPSSLSSIPGGRADGRDMGEVVADMSGPEQLLAMEGKTPEQIETWLNRNS